MSDKKKKTSKLFDYINAVSVTKDTSILHDLDFAKQYVPFVVNRAFSYHHDSVLAANIMNERSWLSPELQAQFLLNTLRARKRFSPWLKNSISDDVNAVAEYYGCSVRHAKTLADLHSPEQLSTIRARLYKGGFASGRGNGHDTTTAT